MRVSPLSYRCPLYRGADERVTESKRADKSLPPPAGTCFTARVTMSDWSRQSRRRVMHPPAYECQSAGMASPGPKRCSGVAGRDQRTSSAHAHAHAQAQAQAPNCTTYNCQRLNGCWPWKLRCSDMCQGSNFIPLHMYCTLALYVKF